MSVQLPNWVQYVQALGPMGIAVAVGLATIIIQKNQWRTANDKLRLDLFEKRFNVYSAAETLKNQQLRDGAVGELSGEHLEKLRKFDEQIAIAQFIFPREVHEYLKELRDRITRLRVSAVQIEQFRLQPERQSERQQHIDATFNELRNLLRESDIMIAKIKPFMDFGHVKL